MGRSSSSFIAKALHDAGIHMGDQLMMEGPGNPKGHYEDREFVALHEKNYPAGVHWAVAPEIPTIDTDAFEEIINNRNYKHDYWGWKDPRTITYIDHYYDLLRDPILVCLFRDPQKVAESLHARDGFPISSGIELAKKYNKQLIKILEKRFT
jgi:hypothetical protein